MIGSKHAIKREKFCYLAPLVGDYRLAARLAGYSPNEKSLRSIAFKLSHDPKIMAKVKENLEKLRNEAEKGDRLSIAEAQRSIKLLHDKSVELVEQADNPKELRQTLQMLTGTLTTAYKSLGLLTDHVVSETRTLVALRELSGYSGYGDAFAEKNIDESGFSNSAITHPNDTRT